MGNFQFRGLGQNKAAEKENIDVQGTFPPAAFLFPIPAEPGFDAVDMFQQFPGLSPVTAPEGGIKKSALIRYLEGIGLKKRSDPYFPQYFPQNPQGIPQNSAGIPLV
jgi:hypothetical protein